MNQPHERIKMRIRRLRQAKGWTQVELAQKAGITQAAVSLLEAGRKKNPGVVTLLHIAKALGTTIEELLK